MRSRLSLVAVLSVVVSGLLLTIWMLVDARQTARLQAMDAANNLSEVVSHDIDHAVETYDLSLQAVQERLRTPGLANLPAEMRRAVLFDNAATMPFFGVRIITNAEGSVVQTSVGRPPVGLNVSERDYFRVQKNSADDRLFVGQPFPSKLSGQESLGVSRRLTNPDGSFAGVVAGTLRLTYFRDLFDHVHMGTSDITSVMLTNGTILVRSPPDPRVPGLSLAGTAILRQFSDAPFGSFEARSPIDGLERLYSFHRIGGLPMIVVVAQTLDGVYAEWRQRAVVVALAGAPLLLAALLLAWTLSQELERRGRAELEASRRGAEFRVTFDHSADGLFLMKVLPDRFVLDRANAALTRLWGLPVGSMEGREPRSFLSPPLIRLMEQHWARCVATGQSVSYSMQVEQGCRRLELDTVVTPVRDDAGRVMLLLGSTRDMTERMEMSRRLGHVQKLETVSQVTAGVTHDFNNLLQTLMVGVRKILASVPDNEARRQLTGTMQSITHGVALTRRLLQFSRQTPPAARPVDLAQLVSGMTDMIGWSLGPAIQLQVVLSGSLWPVMADPTQMEMALLNLAGNARDAMAGGGRLLVRARNATVAEAVQAGFPAKDYVILSVQDSGIGMDTETRARVFDAFFTTKTVDRGTGLGLWMVRGFLQSVGGDVQVDSEPGKGTQISLWLPRLTDDAVLAAAPAAGPVTREQARPIAPPPDVAAKAERPELGQARILLVDDDPLVRDALTRLLVEAGHQVTSLGDGGSAVQALESPAPFDLLIADQSIPGLSGSELVAEAALRRPRLLAMVITGYARLDEISSGVRVLHKPIDADVLLAEVDALLFPAGQVVDA